MVEQRRNFEFQISLPHDRQYRVAELFYVNQQVAEANVENGSLVLEIYPRPGGDPWQIPAEVLTEFMRYATEELSKVRPHDSSDA